MMSPFSSLFSGIKWENNASEDDKKAYGNYDSTVDERYFQDGKYRIIAGDATQPGWGSLVPPGYELIGSRAPVQNRYGHKTSGAGSVYSTTPGQLYLRRKDQPPPTPKPTPPPPPPSNPLPRTTEDDRYALARERAQGHLNKTDSPRLFASSPPPRSSTSGDEQSTSQPYSTARFNHGFGQRSGGSAPRGAAVEGVAGFASSLRDKTTGDIDAQLKRAEASKHEIGSLLRRYAPTFPNAPANFTPDQLIAMANRMNNEIKIS